jgi:hypothetical protein
MHVLGQQAGNSAHARKYGRWICLGAQAKRQHA